MLLQLVVVLMQLQQSDINGELLYNLMTQLAKVTILCDCLMKMLMHITNHKKQITYLLDLHVTHTSIVKLCKLNALY